MAEILLDGPKIAALNALSALKQASYYSDLNSVKALSYAVAHELEYDIQHDVFFVPQTFLEILSAQQIPPVLRIYCMWFSDQEFFVNFRIIASLFREVTDDDIGRLQQVVRRNSLLQHEALRAFLLLAFVVYLEAQAEMLGDATDLGLSLVSEALDRTYQIVPGDNASHQLRFGRDLILRKLPTCLGWLQTCAHEFQHNLTIGAHKGGQSVSPSAFIYNRSLAKEQVLDFGPMISLASADLAVCFAAGLNKEYQISENGSGSLKQCLSSAARIANVELVHSLLHRHKFGGEDAEFMDSILPLAGSSLCIEGRSRAFFALAPALTDTYAVIDELCKSGANPNQPFDSEGNTFLIYAAGRSLQLTRLLLKVGGNVNQANRAGKTPLFVAVQCANPDIVENLLHAQPDIEACDSEGKTALHAAVEIDSERIIRQLLIHNASVNKQNEVGETPLMAAHSETIVNLLCEAGGDVNLKTYSSWDALMFAVRRGNFEVVRALLSRGAEANSITDIGETPVYIAVSYNTANQQAILKILIEFGAEINEETDAGLTPLSLAAQYCESTIVETLINAGAKVNATSTNGDTPLILALRSRNSDKLKIIRMLIEAGANISQANDAGESAPTLAKGDNIPSEVKSLLDMES
jgi:ankyrin repeat protein